MAGSSEDSADSSDLSEDGRDPSAAVSPRPGASAAANMTTEAEPAAEGSSQALYDVKRKLPTEARDLASQPKKSKPAPIKIALGTAAPKSILPPLLGQTKSKAVAQAFNSDEASDEEEMPPEAKMRMRNLGRDTPTAAGPNSFGKTKQGFIDRRNLVERELKKVAADSGDDE